MRLTKKDNSTYRGGVVLLNVSDKYANELYHKLRDLEDIEEDLGIDLITLFKALTRGIYHREYPSGEIKHISTPALWSKIECYNECLECHWVIEHHGLESYGKDWALTKEELL